MPVPFPSATWNQPIAELGVADNATRVYGPRLSVAGGKAGVGHLAAALGDYSVPVWDAEVHRPTTDVRVYQGATYQSMRQMPSGLTVRPQTTVGTNMGLPIGTTIPWNFAWRPGTGTDRIMLIDNLRLPVLNDNGTPKRDTFGKLVLDNTRRYLMFVWVCYNPIGSGDDWWGPNNQNGFGQTAPVGFWSAFTSPTDPSNRKIVVGWAGLTLSKSDNPGDVTIWSPGARTVSERGAGVNKIIGVTRAEEVRDAVYSDGVIPHVMEVTIRNTWAASPYPGRSGVDYMTPLASRCEWTLEQAPSRFGPSDPYDMDRTLMIPEGMVFGLNLSNADITSWVKAKGFTGKAEATARVIARSMSVNHEGRGLSPLETGAWGCCMETDGVIGPARSIWVNDLGVNPSTPSKHWDLSGLITRDNVVVAKTPGAA